MRLRFAMNAFRAGRPLLGRPGSRQPCQGLPSVPAGGGVVVVTGGGVLPSPSANAVVEPISGAAAMMQSASTGPPILASFLGKDMTNPSSGMVVSGDSGGISGPATRIRQTPFPN